MSWTIAAGMIFHSFSLIFYLFCSTIATKQVMASFWPLTSRFYHLLPIFTNFMPILSYFDQLLPILNNLSPVLTTYYLFLAIYHPFKELTICFWPLTTCFDHLPYIYIVILIYFNKQKLQVPLVPQLLCNTAPVTCKYCTCAIMGMVFVGTGMVWHKVTHSVTHATP